ncbi:hypothetical protein EYF80_013162 [Liparis tanakae]|uniref:Uncharacterized protein n=1 Tax=Liparis tanakae TaxID=230148 RepID=A0A4Z2IFM1_9TELE|nr:hypothetical protein EYF80_013162 [Liparis tanakae]
MQTAQRFITDAGFPVKFTKVAQITRLGKSRHLHGERLARAVQRADVLSSTQDQVAEQRAGEDTVASRSLGCTSGVMSDLLA